MSVLKEAEETLAAGYIPWRQTDLFKRLYVLNGHANMIYLYILENFSKNNSKIPSEVGESVRYLANSLDQKNKSESVVKKFFSLKR